MATPHFVARQEKIALAVHKVYDSRMDARDVIISALREHGSLREVAILLGCAWSSLYQLARHERHLGPELARKMRELVDLPESVWLAAMGIDCDVRVSDAP